MLLNGDESSRGGRGSSLEIPSIGRCAFNALGIIADNTVVWLTSTCHGLLHVFFQTVAQAVCTLGGLLCGIRTRCKHVLMVFAFALVFGYFCCV